MADLNRDAPGAADGQDFLDGVADLQMVLAKDYLADPRRYRSRGVRIINLCRSYRYLSEGYYCSLLAEARRQRIIPSVRTITDLSRKSIYSMAFSDFEPRLQRLSKAVACSLVTA